MSDKLARDTVPVSFGAKLAGSQSFAGLFREGMALVEETAAYLDGPGRKESKSLQRNAALAYATESMRLTTRLMQLASWLLLHRAVNEGEMSLVQASQEKTKVKLSPAEPPDEEMARSLKLLERVRRLDATIHAGSLPKSSINPVERQVGLLRAAFERDR
jgi:regulator of CtrA degradation